MDEKNRNVSDTFGKYSNESIGQVKDISSSAWTPISTGTGASAAKHKSSAQPKKQKTAPKARPEGKGKSASSPKGSKKAAGKGKSSGLDGFDLISKGIPSDKSTAEERNPSGAKNNGTKSGQQTASPKGNKSAQSNASSKVNKSAQSSTSSKGNKSESARGSSDNGSQSQKKASVNKKSESRTPKGKDMRDDKRKQQKHIENVRKNRRDYQKSTEDGINHDEFCKKKNENKRKKNHFSRILTVALVLVCAVAAIVAVFYSKGTPVENIIIEGQTIYSDEEIYQAAGIARGRNLFAFSAKKVKHDIITKLPYIKDVVVEKEYPDTLVLRVITTQDKYVITGTSGWVTLDSDGKVVSLSRNKVEGGMYQIEGFDYQKAREGSTYVPQGDNVRRFELMKEIVTLLDKAGVIDTAVIRLHNVEDVVIEYDGKIAVYLGKCEELEKKIPGASGILDIAIANKAKGYIDMRYKDYGTFTPGGMTIQ